MEPVVLTTRRLALRPVREEDLPAFHAHARLAAVWDNAGFPPPRSVEDTRRFVAGEAARWREETPDRLAFSIFRRARGRPAWIGAVHVQWAGLGGGVVEIGYSLHPRAWGKGYMTEAAEKTVEWAFAALAAHRVQATCWTGNARSAAVLRRLGMRREGTLRGYRFHQGVLRDHWLFALTRDDWITKRTRALRRRRTTA